MTTGSDFLAYARAALSRNPPPSEVERRRAVSAAYYGLFHLLADAAASLVAATDEALHAQLARCPDHRTIRAVCDDVIRPQGSRTAALRRLFPEVADERLVTLARAFSQLYQAREIADYELGVGVSQTEALQRLQLADDAAGAFEAVRDLPQTRVFLTAILLGQTFRQRG